MFKPNRKIHSFQGPHTTCLMSAETYSNRYVDEGSSRVSKESYKQKTFIFKHFRFIVYFTSGLLFMTGLALLCFLYLCSYLSARLFIRFQYKMALFFVLLQRQPFSFHNFNTLLVQFLQIMLMFIGGFGYLCMLFVEI